MISDENLEDWLQKMECKLNGIRLECSPNKLKGVSGLPIEVMQVNKGDPATQFVSFDYINEKVETIARIIDGIRFEMKEKSYNG